MANRNNSHHRNGDDANQASDENEENPTRANDHRPTPLAQPATDERNPYPQRLTNEQINGLILQQPGHLEAIIVVAYCFILMLFAFILYRCWPLFLFLFIAHRLITNNNQPGVNSRESRPRHSNLPIYYIFDPCRDAQAERRTAQPTDEGIRFSDNVEMLDNMRNNTVNLNNIQHSNGIINNGNGSISNGQIIAPTTQNEANQQIMDHENDVSQTVVDDPRYNINPLRSVESQDNGSSSDSSDEEDLIVSTESGVDGDDEADSVDDTEQTGRTPPINEHLSNSTQNNLPSNQTNVADEQPTTTTAPVHTEATDTAGTIATPADGLHPITSPRSCLTTGILIPKTTDRARQNGEFSDAHTN